MYILLKEVGKRKWVEVGAFKEHADAVHTMIEMLYNREAHAMRIEYDEKRGDWKP